MNLGTENKNKTIAALGLGVLALGMIVYRFLSPTGGPPPMPSANQPASAQAATAASAGRVQGRKTTTPKQTSGKKVTAQPSLDPTLQLALLKASEDTKYTGTGRNIFRAEVEIPKVVQAPVKEAPPPQQAYVPPPPPPIPLKFFGFASKPGEPKRIFLSSNDGDVFIAAEGDIVDRRYKVVRITNSSVEIEDVLSNNRQSIPLTQG